MQTREGTAAQWWEMTCLFCLSGLDYTLDFALWVLLEWWAKTSEMAFQERSCEILDTSAAALAPGDMTGESFSSHSCSNMMK